MQFVLNNRGYTLLEVSLFLAISGGLTLVALIGLAPRLANVRFSTSMRGLNENVVKQLSAAELGKNTSSQQYNCAASGVNLNVTTGDSNSSSCVFIGKLAVFNSTSVDYRPIIALRTTPGCGESAYSYEALTNCNLARVLVTSSTYQYTNGVKQLSDPVGFGYVRSPDNNSVYKFIINTPASSEFQLGSASLAGSNKEICYKLSSRNAKFKFSTAKSEPSLVFNEVCS